MNKAESARSIDVNPAAVPRLLSTADPSPTLGMLARVAAALGLRIAVAPLDDDEISAITEALRAGLPTDPHALVGAVSARGDQAASR